MAAFRLGAAFGHRAFEFDVKLSADGKSFLLHDATLDRTTNGTGRADALPWGELAMLDAGSWFGPAFAGEALPTLSAVLRYMRANHCAVNVEIKPVPGQEWATGAAVAIDSRLLWQEGTPPPLLSSFSETALEAARQTLPELPRAHLFDRLPEDWPDRLERLECVALDANHRTLSAEIVAQAHKLGYRVLCYTVNEPARVDELFRWGVDSVITDAVDIIPACGPDISR